MLWFLGVTVHTTGVNIEGVLANVVAITIILTFFAGVIIWLIKRSIADAVREAMIPIEKRLDDHDTRIARLEGIEEGKRIATDMAGVTTRDTAIGTTTTTTRRRNRATD